MPKVFRYTSSSRIKQFSSLLFTAAFLLFFLGYAKYIGNKPAIMPLMILISIVVVPGVVAVSLRHSNISIDDTGLSAVVVGIVWRKMQWTSIYSVEQARKFNHRGDITGAQVFVNEIKTGHRITFNNSIIDYTSLISCINRKADQYGFLLHQRGAGSFQAARDNIVKALDYDSMGVG